MRALLPPSVAREYARIEYGGLPVNVAVFVMVLCTNVVHSAGICR